jgi:signal transduction histidine kinase
VLSSFYSFRSSRPYSPSLPQRFENLPPAGDSLDPFHPKAMVPILRAVFDVPTAHIAVLDRRGVIVLVNQAWREFAERNGLPHPNAGIGMNYVQVCQDSNTPEGLACAQGIIEIVAGRLNGFSQEYMLMQTEAGEVWYSSRAIGSGEGGERYVIIAHEDISKQKAAAKAVMQQERERARMEEQARQQVVMEQTQLLHDLKAHMLQRISHEFRTPMATIVTSMYLAEREPEQMKGRFEVMRKQVERLMRMLDDVLTVLQNESGAMVFQPSTQDVRAVVEDAVSIQEMLSGRLIDLTMQVPAARVSMDVHLFELILYNLVSNALKYSPMETVVAVRVQQLDSMLELTVTDAGRGIPAGDQAHVFETFYRGQNIDERPGLGLGLKLVQDAVLACGGTIGFESTEGVGTTFTVRIPAPPMGG